MTTVPCRNAKRTLDNTYAVDKAKLTKEDLDEIWEVINRFEIKGDRYSAALMSHTWG